MIGLSNFIQVIVKLVLATTVLLFYSGGVAAGSATHTYDSLGRLQTVTYSNGVVITYVYDAAGNRTSYTVTGAPN